MAKQTAQLLLKISSELDLDAEELEQLTQQLREELLELDVESVNLVRAGEAPKGAKVGDPISWGTILVTLLAAGGVVTTLINAIQSWLARDERRSIIMEINGDKLQITGVSSKEQQQLIDAWIDRHTKS
ncbi:MULTISPECIES: hypothetical protein [Trichocoleus]|uniref:Uncharacterized protein n=1 Tax=Trichocoleus desertorum GB2-A4 TaxID=2933944 RepID=A0ABV0J6S0_9CYAN|nr:hypothetical protein [Trichocoleus sp. FACHB-46]MBD1862435.1 hypothetical protein [Trichocoleus sp. FACHB-46]